MNHTKQDLILLFTAFIISSGLIFLSPYFIVPVVCCTVMWALERHKQFTTIIELEDRISDVEVARYEEAGKIEENAKCTAQKLAEMDAEITKLRAAHSMKFGNK